MDVGGVLRVGVLALQGDVREHLETAKNASRRLNLKTDVRPVRTRENLKTLDALIIPGGESTTLQKLCEREGMFEDMKRIKNIFGTCAGAIFLAKTVLHKTKGQRTLSLMDITVDRNAYGRQNESFEKDISTRFGRMRAVFIRAPRVRTIGKTVEVIARDDDGVLACEQGTADRYYLASCFHPELTSGVFHEYFLKRVQTAL